MIDLYTWKTPNGRKVSIMLEACDLPYRAHAIDITKDEQFHPDFLAISPNNRIPAIVDSEGPDGLPISMFESGAILLYLAEKTGRFIPTDVRKRLEMMEWLMWQMGGFGPFLGQTHHFNVYAKIEVPYAKDRYQQEAHRLWAVLNQRLTDREFIVDELSIADFAIYPWTMRFNFQQIDPTEYPAVHRYIQRMGSFVFVERGMTVLD